MVGEEVYVSRSVTGSPGPIDVHEGRWAWFADRSGADAGATSLVAGIWRVTPSDKPGWWHVQEFARERIAWTVTLPSEAAETFWAGLVGVFEADGDEPLRPLVANPMPARE